MAWVYDQSFLCELEVFDHVVLRERHLDRVAISSLVGDLGVIVVALTHVLGLNSFLILLSGSAFNLVIITI